MSEETSVQDHNDGTWSGIKKTIIGTLGTLVLGGGTWVGTHLFGGGESKSEAPAQTATPNIIINNSQQQAAPATKTVVVQQAAPAQAAPAKPAEPAKPKKEFTEDPKW